MCTISTLSGFNGNNRHGRQTSRILLEFLLAARYISMMTVAIKIITRNYMLNINVLLCNKIRSLNLNISFVKVYE